MSVTSYILITIKQGKEHEVADEIKQMPNVTEVQIVYGMFDLVAKIVTNELSELDAIVTSIRKINGVEQTSTLISS